MVDEGRECEAIVTQLMAARAALDKASLSVMSHYIDQCLLDPSGQTDRARLDRIVSFFLKFASSADAPHRDETAASEGE